jgi:hypothetical protein
MDYCQLNSWLVADLVFATTAVATWAQIAKLRAKLCIELVIERDDFGVTGLTAAVASWAIITITTLTTLTAISVTTTSTAITAITTVITITTLTTLSAVSVATTSAATRCTWIVVAVFVNRSQADLALVVDVVNTN